MSTAYYLIIAFLLIARASSQISSDCPNEEDYSPCLCSAGGVITCDQIPLAEVQQIFNRTLPADLYQLKLTPAPTDTAGIPNDLLVNKRFEQIYLYCPNGQYLMTVHPDAFLSSRDLIDWLHIYNCDLNQFNFGFMAGFDQLTSLTIRSSSNLSAADWVSLPPLPKLDLFDLYACTEMNDWTIFPLLINGLEEFFIQNSRDIDDQAVDRILNQLVLPTSKDTLKTLYVANNQALRRLPAAIPRFTALHSLALFFDNFVLLPSYSLVFTAPVRFIYLYGSYVTTIEPHAFEGEFSGAFVNLVNNKLIRFESSVFKPMLEQMATSSAGGTLLISDNPFDCDDPCHLAWLIRDNRNLLAAFDTFYPPECSNGTLFTQLDPNGYDTCP